MLHGLDGLDRRTGSPPPRLRSARVRAAIVAPAVAASLLVAWGTWRFGSAVNDDAVIFISAARNLAFGNDPFAGRLPADWPPLYMFVLAAPGVFGVDPLVTAGFLNPAALGLTGLVAGLSFQRATGAPRIAVAVTAVIAFSIPLTQAASTVGTEPLFILLVILSLVCVVRSIEEDSPRRLYLAAALAALACLTRYAGVALVASTLLVLLVAGRRVLPRTLGRMAAYAAIATAPLALWLLRNWWLTATLAGDRSEAGFPVVYNLARTAGTLVVWAVPWIRGGIDGTVDHLLEWEPSRGGAVAALMFAGTVLAVTAAARLAVKHGLGPKAGRRGLASPFFVAMSCFAGVYLVFIVAVASAVRIHTLGDRLLAPVFVPLVLAAALAGAGIGRGVGQSPPRRGRRWLAWAGAAYVAAYAACCAPELARWLDGQHAFQYNARLWRESALILWLKDAGAGSLHTNQPHLLYLHVPASAPRWLPREPGSLRRRTVQTPSRVGWAPSGAVGDDGRAGAAPFPRAVSTPEGAEDYVVWFHRNTNGYEYDLPRLAAGLGLRREREFPDGVVFAVPGPSTPRRSP